MAPEPYPPDSNRLAFAHSQIVDRIRNAEDQFGREPGSVRLLAVSKRHSQQSIERMHHAGQRAFGENQVQEAVNKIQALSELALEWHFIGPIQSNKTQVIAGLFDWVHSVDRAKIIERLSRQRPKELEPLNVCIQVKLGTEATKSGAPVAEVAGLVSLAAQAPHLRVRGLMALPPPSQDFDTQRYWFRQLAALQAELVETGMRLDTLSMGMTSDLEAAIAEGSTMVRIGTALFGQRDAAVDRPAG